MDEISTQIGDRTISHRGPAPFKVETFKSGFSVVTNANGANWLSGRDGATAFDDVAAARMVAAALNAARH